MGHIYDRIRETGVLRIPSQTPNPMLWSSDDMQRELGELLWRATVIDAGSVARYFWMGSEDDTDFGIGDFPNLSSPFEVFFLEQHNSQLAENLKEDSRHIAGGDSEFVDYGGLWWAVDLASPYTDRDARIRTWAALQDVLGERTYDGTVRWGLWGFLFAWSSAEQFVHGPQTTWLLPIKDNGLVAIDSGGYDPALISIPHGISLDQGVEREKLAETLEAELLTMLFALCTINSPLSELRLVTETRYCHYILDIELLIAKLNRLGNASKAGLAHALLARRSDFRTARGHSNAVRPDASA